MIAKGAAGLVVTVAAVGGGTGVAYSVSVKHIGDVIKEKNMVLIAKEDAHWEAMWTTFKTKNDFKSAGFKELKIAATASGSSSSKTDLYNECEKSLNFFHSSMFRSTTETNTSIIEDFEKACVAKISAVHTIPSEASKLDINLLKNYTKEENKKPELTKEWKELQNALSDSNQDSDNKTKILEKCQTEADKWYLGEKDPTYLLVSNICKATS